MRRSSSASYLDSFGVAFCRKLFTEAYAELAFSVDETSNVGLSPDKQAIARWETDGGRARGIEQVSHGAGRVTSRSSPAVYPDVSSAGPRLAALLPLALFGEP